MFGVVAAGTPGAQTPRDGGLAAPGGAARGSEPCPAAARQGPRREAASRVPKSQGGLWGVWEPPWPYWGSRVPSPLWGSFPLLGLPLPFGAPSPLRGSPILQLCAAQPPGVPLHGERWGAAHRPPPHIPITGGHGHGPTAWEEPQGAPRPRSLLKGARCPPAPVPGGYGGCVWGGSAPATPPVSPPGRQHSRCVGV